MEQIHSTTEQIVLSLKTVCHLTGLSKSTVYRLERQGSFPKRIKLSERRVAWLALDIYDFITERVEASHNV